MITTSTGAKKLESSDNWREIFPNPGTSAAGAHNASVDAQDRIQAEVAPIINGKRCSLGAASGDYVLLRNSTIAGKTDGAYVATKAIPANTDLDSTYLGSPITGGLMNELNSKIANHRFVDGGKNPSNWNNAYATTENTIILYSIAVASIPTGGPTGAYPYGTLIAITSSTTSGWEFTHKLIYMVDNINDPAIYIKNELESYWFKFAGTSVNPVS